jgi:tetratricopeptide (TPR) repeat protein
MIPASLNLMRNRQAFGLAAILVRFALVAAFLFVAGGGPRSNPVTRWLASGDQAARQGHTGAALAAYEHGIKPHAVIYERLVRASLDAGRYDDAQVYLYALADLDGWNAERRGQLRTILEHHGETARANALIYASLEGSPSDPRVLRHLAQEQINRLEWEQAEMTLGQLLVFDPGDTQALYQLALLLAPVDQNYAREYLGRVAHDPAWAGRAETVRAALSVYDGSALTDAHTYLGVTLVGLGEWPFAERALQMALEANAVNPVARAYLGFARDQQGRDGLPDLEAALGMAPNDPTIYYLLGQHWRWAGAREKEYEAFAHAYWLSPDNPALAVEVGVALQNQSDLAGAESWFRRAVGLDSNDLQWRRVLAAFYADTGFQLEPTGLAFIEESNQIAPDDPDIRASLGWAYYQANDSLRAYDELSAAVGLDPDNPRTRYYFGMVLERRGDQQGAADSYWFVVEELGPDTGFGLLAARALQRLGYAQ